MKRDTERTEEHRERCIQLGSRVITEHSLPYVIAEIGVNHEGSMDLAKRLIDLAR